MLGMFEDKVKTLDHIVNANNRFIKKWHKQGRVWRYKEKSNIYIMDFVEEKNMIPK